jgi:hypothetical protein
MFLVVKLDNSDCSAEEETKIKGTLSSLDNKLRSVGGILTLAAPLVQLLVNHLPK